MPVEPSYQNLVYPLRNEALSHDVAGSYSEDDQRSSSSTTTVKAHLEHVHPRSAMQFRNDCCLTILGWRHSTADLGPIGRKKLTFGSICIKRLVVAGLYHSARLFEGETFS